MPTKRRPINRKQRHRISPAAVEAYRNGDDKELHRLLNLPPWIDSPLEVHPDDSPAVRNMWWADSLALRAELEAAVKQG